MTRSTLMFITQPTVDINISTENKILTLLAVADSKIKPLQDAVDLDIASNEEKSRLLKWKKFRVTLSRIDINEKDIVLPNMPD